MFANDDLIYQLLEIVSLRERNELRFSQVVRCQKGVKVGASMCVEQVEPLVKDLQLTYDMTLDTSRKRYTMGRSRRCDSLSSP